MDEKLINHPQETIIDTFDFNGVIVDLVKWTNTIWCGKIAYAVNNTNEPDVDKIMSEFQALNIPTKIPNGREYNWDVCMSVNYLSAERPNGVMFGFLVSTESQPDGFDIYKAPAAKYMRILMNDETAKMLNREPFHGGIPPYQWIGELIAPNFDYKYGKDTLPIFEYYGYYNPDKNAHEFSYLYVPVGKK
jgi:hypothetical protein